MAFRTITARYAGKCKRCSGPIEVGDRIRFGGRGRTYHFASECPASDSYEGDASEAINYGGRCEDAPCCGHGGRCGIPAGYGASYAGVEF